MHACTNTHTVCVCVTFTVQTQNSALVYTKNYFCILNRRIAFHTDGQSIFSGAQDSLRVSYAHKTLNSEIFVMDRYTTGTLRQCVVMLYRLAGVR